MHSGQVENHGEPEARPEETITSAEEEKESLLERAVNRQLEQNAPEQAVFNEAQLNSHVSAENIQDQPQVEQARRPNVGAMGEEAVIIEPGDVEKPHQNDQSHGIDAGENILHDMDRHSLIIRERSSLFGGSGVSDAFTSLVELVGMRSLLQRALLAGLGIVAVLWAWNTFFEKGTPVETVLVEPGEIYQSITVPGRVVSKQRTNVSASHTGRVVKIFVKEGDRVKEGQTLAQLDDRELVSRLNQAKSNSNSAREGVVQAQRTLDRLKTAYKKGAVARRFVEDAEVDLRNARSQAGIAVEEVHAATLDVNKQQIKAPFSGTITSRFVELGQWIGPSESMFTLVNESQREIEVRVDAADSVAIDVGQIVAVSTDAFPGLEWNESVVRLGAAAHNDNNSNSVRVYISLGNDAPSLRFGQQVDADIRTAWNPNTLKVPFEALINRDGQTFVAVVDSDNYARLTPVETGIEDFSMVEIKQGLVDGQLVILTKGRMIKNGDKVYPARSAM